MSVRVRVRVRVSVRVRPSALTITKVFPCGKLSHNMMCFIVDEENKENVEPNVIN